MNKTIYILQNIEELDKWEIFKELEEAQYSQWKKTNFAPKKEGDKWVIITKEI